MTRSQRRPELPVRCSHLGPVTNGTQIMTDLHSDLFWQRVVQQGIKEHFGTLIFARPEIECRYFGLDHQVLGINGL